MVKLASRFGHLLTKHMKPCQHFGPRLVGIYFNVVPDAVSRPKSINAPGSEQLSFDDILQQFLCILEQRTGLLSHFRIIENLRETPSQFPGMKERRPIDVMD